MKKHIKIIEKEWDKLESLSTEYKEENSDLTNNAYRNWIFFHMMIRMEDSQLKVAIFEQLKNEGYISKKIS